MLKKTLILGCIIAATFTATWSQTISVKKEKAPVRKEYGEGFEVVLEGSTYAEVQTALGKWMKSFGKTKQYDEDGIMVEEPVLEEKQYPGRFFAKPRQLGNIVSAWFGILPDEWSQNDLEAVMPELEKLLHGFAVNFHKEKIQRQIDESIQASEIVDRQLQRLRSQHRTLSSKIEDNKRKKLELERALVENRVELEQLTRSLEQNKKDQDSVVVAAEQIKRAIDMHKLRQEDVQ